MSRQALLALSLLLVFQGPASGLNNNEGQKAKEMMDSLSKKLHSDVKELKETIEEAKENISKIVDRLVIVKKVQLLLAQLNNQPVPGKMCEHRYIVPDFHYKQAILIQTKSALPSRYTATVEGKRSSDTSLYHTLLFGGLQRQRPERDYLNDL